MSATEKTSSISAAIEIVLYFYSKPVSQGNYPKTSCWKVKISS